MSQQLRSVVIEGPSVDREERVGGECLLVDSGERLLGEREYVHVWGRPMCKSSGKYVLYICTLYFV